MKKTLIFIFMVVLFGLAGNSSATSPMPEELKAVQTENICTLHVAHSLNREQGLLTEQVSSTLTFDVSVSKKAVLEKTMKYLDNRLNEGNVSEFKLECKFAR